MATDHLTLLALAPPSARQLRLLEQLPPETDIAVGKTLEAVDTIAPHADVILLWPGDQPALAEVLRRAKKLRWIHSMSAGVENILMPELLDCDAPLTNAKGVYRRSLAEFVIASILFFAKDLRRMVRNQAVRRWEPFAVEEIHGRTVGIIGYGAIGSAVAERVHGLGMKVVALRKRPQFSDDDPYVDQVFAPDQMADLLRLSDYVVLTAPLTMETRGMLGEAELGAMKRNAVLVNIGRGPLLDEAALARALREKRIRGAALDVFEHEPLPENHPYWELENVLLSPHCADHTATWLDESMQFFIDNFHRFQKGEPLLNIVSKELGY